MLYFSLTTALLALLLLLPAWRIVYVLSVRRLQRKTGQKLPENAIRGQKNRAWFLAIILVTLFSLLFNYNLIGVPGNG